MSKITHDVIESLGREIDLPEDKKLRLREVAVYFWENFDVPPGCTNPNGKCAGCTHSGNDCDLQQKFLNQAITIIAVAGITK